jgi:hypothetical protein
MVATFAMLLWILTREVFANVFTGRTSNRTTAFWLSPFLVCRATCNRAGLNLEIDKPKPPCELCLQARFLLPSLHLLRSFRIGGC